MSEEQIRIMRQQIENLTRRANLKKTPNLKISKKGGLARVTFFRNVITLGADLLSLWREGKISEDDVECTLAHEIGHIIDRNRGIRSVWARSWAIAVLYLPLGFVLPWIVSSFPVAPWLLVLLGFIIWGFFAPCILRWAEFVAEFEADRIASVLIDDDYQYASSIVRKRRPLSAVAHRAFEVVETWELIERVLHPSLSERLRNLNFEIKKDKIEIQRIKDCSQHA